MCLNFPIFKMGSHLEWTVLKGMPDVSSSPDVSIVLQANSYMMLSQVAKQIKGPLKHVKDLTVSIKGTCSTKVR